MKTKKTNEDIENAERMLETDNLIYEFGNYSRLYHFATENIDGYFDKLNFQKKKVLSVTSSGDHALNAVLHGAEEVDCFDINRFTEYYLNLKKSAVMNLEYDQFKRFLYRFDRGFLNQESYCLLKEDLDDRNAEFWTTLMKKYPPEAFKNNLFYSSNCESFKIQKINSYLKEEKYYKLKEQLKNIKFNFIPTDIKVLPEKLQNKKYDTMLFSNISNYLEEVYPSNDLTGQLAWIEELKAFKKLILEYSNHLKPNGDIAVGYIYSHLDFRHLEPFSCDKRREEIFNPNVFQKITFPGYSPHGQEDAIVLYKKPNQQKGKNHYK